MARKTWPNIATWPLDVSYAEMDIISPPVIFFTLVAVSIFIGRLYPKKLMPAAWSSLTTRGALAVLLMAILGGILTQAIAPELRAAGSQIAYQGSNTLATAGPYSVMRHPMFLSEYLLMVPALAILFDNQWIFYVAGGLNFIHIWGFVMTAEDLYLEL